MIEINGLSKRYGSVEAVKDLTVTVASGELFGFLGHNGAGKTTTMLILAGLLAPSAGHAKINGHDVVKEALKAKASLGYIPDRPYLHERLSGREVMRFFGGIYCPDRPNLDDEIDAWLTRFSLSEQADHLVESYSHGMKQRLTLAATLLHDPPVMIVDEPMVGLDPHGARLFKTLMRERCARGKTVLMSTHTLQVAEETCDRVGIMRQGQLVALGTVSELRQSIAKDAKTLEDIFIHLTEEAATEIPS